ncbi:FmdB family zinc ribbon protein [Rhabdothermincola salaria]|uniref:FmdB family zinc ribbon protein n=1 Tax=Rhabdothermincola salaria TaxID=2903142 RepID=UPI001E630564|nr:FmdB family zinc ribbon protein [Rhabdothermincola salaria]MCD9623781.1 FmdB family transcriptional regulator [Rhabdothermincola salaria]
MPTYEYRCKDCGRHLEAQQAFTDDPLTECPECGGTLKKKFGSVGIAFKGSGFYKNDARQTSSSSASSTESSSGGASTTDSGSTSTSSDSASKSTSSDSAGSTSGSDSTSSSGSSAA